MSAKILLVEDDNNIRSMISEYLDIVGFQVKSACEGREALKYLSEETFDVLITDINMPNGMGGIELINTVFESKNTIPIIAMSGHNKNSEYVKGLRAEVTFKEKPVPMPQLIETINQIIALKQGVA